MKVLPEICKYGCGGGGGGLGGIINVQSGFTVFITVEILLTMFIFLLPQHPQLMF